MTERNRKTHQMSDLDPHSERLSESFTAKQEEEMALERSRPKPHATDGQDRRKRPRIRRTSSR